MGWIVPLLAIFVVYRMAEVERRNARLWALGAIVTQPLLWTLGLYWFVAAPIVVVGAFILLWMLKARDEPM